MGKLKESEYSLIDGKSLEGMLYVKIEQMPEQELELLLAKPLWTLTEALQVACNRKLSFPSSCFITREVAYVLRQFKMAVKNKEIKVEPTKDCQIENHRDLMISDESASVILKISFSQQDRLIISAASFIEWAVNSGIPLPEAVLKKIGISPLIEHSFESYWGRIREDIFNLKMRTIRKI